MLTTAQPMAVMPNIQYRLTGGIDYTISSNLGTLLPNYQLAESVKVLRWASQGWPLSASNTTGRPFEVTGNPT